MLIVDWNSTTTTTPAPLSTTTLEALNITLENVSVLVDNASATASPELPTSKFKTVQVVIFIIIATCLSIITVVGNFMVMISFKIDKQLQTISNYFLFSLAMADFAIGLISMPLFTVYTLLGYWPLGPTICDTWLALDYLVSNASVLNLLIISFDRYFSVTRPLTYRAKRTTNRATFMIGCAWGVSLLLWPPWIYAWPYIEGERTVPATECYIQFIETNHYITFGTAIAAFYVPVTVMCILYFRIWKETKKRQKDLPNLQAGKKDSSKRSNSSDEQAQVDMENWKRTRSQSNHDQDGGLDDFTDSNANQNKVKQPRARALSWRWFREWCVAWWHSGREEDPEDYEDIPSDMGYATPVSVETPLQSSVSRCTSMNMIRDPYALGQTPPARNHPPPPLAHLDARSLPSAPANRLHSRSISNDSVYTILIQLPPRLDSAGATDGPTIKMISDEPVIGYRGLGRGVGVGVGARLDGEPFSHSPGLNRRPSQFHDARMPLSAKAMQKDMHGKNSLAGPKNPNKKKKKTQEKKADKKAAKTLSAILLTFIITWTPYNILVLIKPLTSCLDCIPQPLWDFFYYLCYINSTINPVCYALCNASFRRTYVRILTCKWQNRNRAAMNRGFYN
ncbi:unnamed protein product [Bemisia tabaci]|uniref:G-protein coupled receptors family 1 profile domain-containing protein n=1 Tax=Bemisia tabaci TaxID=7038 RepID=A0A9P0A951_BEMTA|nr:unnamed protein product [Bemisia tabaci]